MQGERSFYAVYGFPDRKNFSCKFIRQLKDLEKDQVLRGVTYPSKGQEIFFGEKGNYQIFEKLFGQDTVLWSSLNKLYSPDKGTMEAFVIRGEVINELEFEEARKSLDLMLKPEIVDSCWYEREELRWKKKKKDKK